ncbi:MAG: tetratricopeptide repeat protein, partial [Bacteroidota bacterium]
EALHSLNEALTLSRSTEERMELEGELIAVDISQGHFEAARRRCLNAIERFNDPTNRAGLGIFYNALGIVYFYQNKFDEATQYFTRARALLEPGGPKDKLISNYLNLGNVFSAQDNFTEAERHWQRALVLSKEIGNVQQEAQIYNNLGISSYKSARYDDALHYYQQALEVFTRIGNLPGKAFCLTNTGEVHFTQSEYQKALACWRESLKLYQLLQDNQGLAETHNQLAQIDILLEDLEPARHHLDIAAEITEHEAIESQRGLCYLLSGSVAILEGNFKRAEELLAAAKAFFKSVKDEKGYLLSLLKFGEVARLGFQPRLAREFFEEVLQVSSQCNLPLSRAEALLQLALEARSGGSGRQQKPFLYLREAFGLLQHEVVCETTWKVCYYLGKEYLGRGLDARGKEFLRHAQKVLEFLSSSFTEEELRRKFLASQRRGEILNEINLLCMNSVHGRQN